MLIALAVAGYDAFVRPSMLDWGSTSGEQRARLPGDEIVDDVMTGHTRAVSIDAPPEAIWPWVVQIGDHRAGYYSYDWIERLSHTVHYVDGRRSATRIHPELQNVQIGDRITIGSFARSRIDAPVTVLEPNRAFVIGTWAFVLVPLDSRRTRLLLRTRDMGWVRRIAPQKSGLWRGLGAVVDYVVGEPLHFAMERKMLLGLKQRAEQAPDVVA
jgi:hypothetical protein